MYDARTTARTIATDWPALVGTLPEELATTIAVFEAASYAQRPSAHIDVDEITADNAESFVTDLAAALAAETRFDEARDRVLQALGGNVAKAAGTAVPEIIEAITPDFDRAAEQYAGAVELLPGTITADSLIDAGPDVLAAYQDALGAVAYLRQVDGWLAGLANLPACAAAPDPELRVLRPTNGAQLSAISRARAANAEGHLERLNPMYVAAVRAGVEFAINTPREAVKLREEIRAANIAAAREAERNPVHSR